MTAPQGTRNQHKTLLVNPSDREFLENLENIADGRTRVLRGAEADQFLADQRAEAARKKAEEDAAQWRSFGHKLEIVRAKVDALQGVHR